MMWTQVSPEKWPEMTNIISLLSFYADISKKKKIIILSKSLVGICIAAELHMLTFVIVKNL